MEQGLIPTIKNIKIVGVKKITDKSDEWTQRAVIDFENGYGLSVIRGVGSYGGKEGLFEIAPYNKAGEMDGSVLGIENDDVEGWLNEEDVMGKIKQITDLR